MKAAQNGHVDAIEVLLTRGARINQKDEFVSHDGYVCYYDDWYYFYVSMSTFLSCWLSESLSCSIPLKASHSFVYSFRVINSYNAFEW